MRFAYNEIIIDDFNEKVEKNEDMDGCVIEFGWATLDENEHVMNFCTTNEWYWSVQITVMRHKITRVLKSENTNSIINFMVALKEYLNK